MLNIISEYIFVKFYDGKFDTEYDIGSIGHLSVGKNIRRIKRHVELKFIKR